MKEELELISEIYKRINISFLAPRDVIKEHLRDARRMLNDLTVKLSQHDVIKNEVSVCSCGIPITGLDVGTGKCLNCDTEL
jgi:hypothetical protein